MPQQDMKMKLNISLTRTLPANLRGMRAAAHAVQAMVLCVWGAVKPAHARIEDGQDSIERVALAGWVGM
jgi:hypothetical protein